ncbi:MAG: hypothetical protein LIO68_02510 [Rikenellaceae bacterium]|nr:hypothetical protein [Rikenellaceae bacterium]
MLRPLAGLLLLLALLPQAAQAQFYYNGRGPMDIKWRQIKSPRYKLVYPDYYAPTAVALAGFMDSIAPTITRGFTRTPQRLPIVLHTENLYSNGEVVWAPKRMELMTTAPAGDIYADPWLKQLAVHESRHVVQLSSLRSGVTRVASWLFGQAGTCVGMLVVPKWFLEGDATMAETQFSEFGRAYQPSFTVGMRALFAADSANVDLKSDKWIAGSYRTYIPGIYEYGYQMVAAGERYHGPEMWGNAVEYAGKWPIFIVPLRIYLKRHHDTHLSDLSRMALNDLYEHWKPYSAVPDSYATLTAPQHKRSGFTTYSDPLFSPLGILATKTDYNTPVRFVTIDTAANTERTLRWIAPPSSRPVLAGNTLWWTEFKPHPVWEYKNYSVVRSLDLTTGKRRVYGRWQANYFATPLTAGEREFIATVSPDSLGGSDLVLHDARDFRETDRLRFDLLTTLHGMAWDSTTRTLAFIALGEEGMHLCRTSVTAEGTLTPVEDITAPSMVTIGGLTADGRGNLYFSSIQSGKDEIHTIDLLSPDLTERRLTTSRFGAYSPSADTSQVLFTTYTADGYMVASSQTGVGATKDTVLWSRLPENLLNIPAPAWDVPKMSSLPMDDSVTTHKVRKYNKTLRWFNVHSWAPVAADVNDLLNTDERTLNVGFGASLFFQSVMGDSYGSATYGRLHGDNWLQASWTYAGLPVQITAEVEYGGGKQGVYIPADDYNEGIRAPGGLKNYLHAKGSIAVPLRFSGGSHFRLLQPSFTVTHYNSLLYVPGEAHFTKGYQKYQASLWWSDNRRASMRSITPRLGYALRADVTGAFNDRFGMIYSLYARGYLPGFMRNHSITLRAAGMYQTEAELGFTQKPLFPRGAYNGWAAKYYGAGSLDYTFPLCYPDGGINGLIYFKRIWLNLFGDYSRGAYFAGGGSTRNRDIWSYGGDIAFELNVVGSTSPATVKFTLASPSNDKFYFGVGLSMDF